MLDRDVWQEIFEVVRANRLRSFLTAFSVAWGIFMLIVLLGSGTGLEHGIEYQFRDDAINSIWVFPGQTSLPHAGLRPNRQVQMTNLDHQRIETGVNGVEHITSRFWIRGALGVAYKGETGTFDIRAVHPDHQYLEKTIITRGRYLNELDIVENRKVAVIGDHVKEALFKTASAIGEEIKINGIAFKVVGIFIDDGGESEMEKIYLPISTAQRTYNGANRVGQIMLTTGDAAFDRTQAMAAEITQKLADWHDFDPADRRAVFVRNNVEEFQRFTGLMRNIRIFIWIVGFGTILAGVVGVSNIMMIAVRERTREIGIRKALGASPWSVVALVLQESVLLTGVAGYVGLVLGVAVLEVVAANLPGGDYFRNPEVDLRIALWATVVLVVAGTLAGLAPALKAAHVQPIEALRDE